MKYRFEHIENGSIESAAVLDIEEIVDGRAVKRSAVHNLIITITDHEAEIPNDATALMFLAEQNGGELVEPKGRKPRQEAD